MMTHVCKAGPRACATASPFLLGLLLFPSCGGGEPAGPDSGDSGLDSRVEWWDAAETLKKVETGTQWGRLHGPHSEWSQDGIKIVAGRYEDGRQVGSWDTFGTDGTRISNTNFVAGKEQGTSTAWYPSGQLHVTGDYAGGLQVGSWKTYAEDGESLIEETILEGGVVMTLDAWAPTGEKVSELRNDVEMGSGTLIQWWESGEIKREVGLKNGELHGVDTRYHEIGEKMSEETWEMGSKDGLARTWHPSGDLRSEGEVRGGVPTGVWHEWHPGGQLQKEGLFSDGVQSGEWRQWHENGNLSRVVVFEGGVPSGLLQEWHSDGSRSSFGNLVAERQLGPWFFWSDGGELDGQRSGQYSGRQRTGDLTTAELATGVELGADPAPIIPDPGELSPKAAGG